MIVILQAFSHLGKKNKQKHVDIILIISINSKLFKNDTTKKYFINKRFGLLIYTIFNLFQTDKIEKMNKLFYSIRIRLKMVQVTKPKRFFWKKYS